ncbi:MAG: phosphopantetheine-binding protein [Oscillospiraceae bacterium]|nr:phosphopantetheine-binding protein [Oscillospiraceae bacterium]
MVYEKVISFIADQLDIEEETLNEESTFEEIGADEVDIAELVLAVEGEFEIEIHEDEVTHLSGVSDLVSVVQTAIELG